jgi:sugar phosphate isomerase/epimerase
LIPGDGAIDFASALRAIRAMNYQGWVTIELYPYVENPDEAASRALKRITEILATP